MSDIPRRRFWNFAGILFATVFLSVGALFSAVAALALGWIEAPIAVEGPVATPFGPLGASLVAIVFLYIGLRCNLWVELDERAVVIRGLLLSRRLARGPGLTAENEFRTRPTGLRLSSGERSVVVYPRPWNADDLLRALQDG